MLFVVMIELARGMGFGVYGILLNIARQREKNVKREKQDFQVVICSVDLYKF